MSAGSLIVHAGEILITGAYISLLVSRAYYLYFRKLEVW